MSVPALERGVAILRMFRRDRFSISAPEVVAELGLARSSAHALLNALVGLGLLRRMSEGQFALDGGVMGLGFEYLASLPVTDLAAPILERLRDETGFSTHLAIRQGRSILYLSRFSGRQAVTRNVSVGSSLPAHSTAMGRILLSDLEPIALRALYGDEWLALSREFRGDYPDFEILLRADRQLGLAISDGQHEPGVRAVAAPVRDATLQVVAAINAVSVGDSVESLDAVAALVMEASRAISGLLGAPGTLPAVGGVMLENQLR